MDAEHREWGLAGFLDEKRGLSRPLRPTEWLKPADIQLDADRLVYSFVPESRVREVPKRIGKIKAPSLQGEALFNHVAKTVSPPHRLSELIRPDDALLDGFLKLVNGSPEEILGYAQKYGVLQICEHGLPYTHNPPPVFYEGEELVSRCLGRQAERANYLWEPLESWGLFTRQMTGILNVAAQLHKQHPGGLEDWRAIYAVPWQGEEVRLRLEWHERLNGTERLDFDVSRLQLVQNWLMDVGGVRPELSGQGVLEFGAPGLFGNLVFQLVLAVSQTEGLAMCSECGMSYIPKRRPAHTRNNYCDACREKGVPQRYAARNWYREHRAKPKRARAKGSKSSGHRLH